MSFQRAKRPGGSAPPSLRVSFDDLVLHEEQDITNQVWLGNHAYIRNIKHVYGEVMYSFFTDIFYVPV